MGEGAVQGQWTGISDQPAGFHMLDTKGNRASILKKIESGDSGIYLATKQCSWATHRVTDAQETDHYTVL